MINKGDRVVTCDQCGARKGLGEAQEQGWELDWESGEAVCLDCSEEED